jgi:hypothetical protein
MNSIEQVVDLHEYKKTDDPNKHCLGKVILTTVKSHHCYAIKIVVSISMAFRKIYQYRNNSIYGKSWHYIGYIFLWRFYCRIGNHEISFIDLLCTKLLRNFSSDC